MDFRFSDEQVLIRLLGEGIRRARDPSGGTRATTAPGGSTASWRASSARSGYLGAADRRKVRRPRLLDYVGYGLIVQEVGRGRLLGARPSSRS